jgi:hypothetical protein
MRHIYLHYQGDEVWIGDTDELASKEPYALSSLASLLEDIIADTDQGVDSVTAIPIAIILRDS